MGTFYLCSGGLFLLPAVRDLPGHRHGCLLGRHQVCFMLFSHFFHYSTPFLLLHIIYLYNPGLVEFSKFFTKMSQNVYPFLAWETLKSSIKLIQVQIIATDTYPNTVPTDVIIIWTVLRTRDVYPGSRILIFINLGSWIQQQHQKRRGKIFFILPFFVATNILKLYKKLHFCTGKENFV